jgi:hypothetical protein
MAPLNRMSKTIRFSERLTLARGRCGKVVGKEVSPSRSPALSICNAIGGEKFATSMIRSG